MTKTDVPLLFCLAAISFMVAGPLAGMIFGPAALPFMTFTLYAGHFCGLALMVSLAAHFLRSFWSRRRSASAAPTSGRVAL
jgi:hypothetical protein